MRPVYAWSAARSGAGMTIKGIDQDGRSISIGNVVKIGTDRSRTGCSFVFATTRSGETFELSLTPFARKAAG